MESLVAASGHSQSSRATPRLRCTPVILHGAMRFAERTNAAPRGRPPRDVASLHSRGQRGDNPVLRRWTYKYVARVDGERGVALSTIERDARRS